MIDVARDHENVVQALVEILEEEFAFSRVRRVLDNSEEGDRGRIVESLPPRTLSPGYYRWASYLFWLEARRGAGIEFEQIDGREMDGLVAVKRARAQWEAQHPACPCGARQDTRFETKCRACGLEFAKRSV